MGQNLKVISAKVSDDELQSVDENAAAIGMSRSEFIRSLLLQKNEKLEQLLRLPESVIVHDEEAGEVENLLEHLQRRHPNYSKSKILKSALLLTADSEKQLVSLKLKKYL